MKTKYLVLPLLLFVFATCNKEKKLLKHLVGNWNIESSVITIVDENGNETTLENRSDAGKLVIYEDPENPSKERKLYAFDYANSDTIQTHKEGVLTTDERVKRIILKNALTDSTVYSDIVWTIEKSRKNKQTWSTYGVDSVLFYPSNNNNPGAAANWVYWTIELKRE